jgi:hypothetical protein
MIKAKRLAPRQVPPVAHDNITYEKHGMSTVVAKDKNSQELWRVQVYDVQYNNKLERDVQDIHIKELKLDDKKEKLLIKDEKNRNYSLDIRTQAVIKL